MKIQKALEIANDCDLETVGEAIYNIKIHAGNLFGYGDAKKELEELNNTWAWIKEHRKTPDGKYHIDENTRVNGVIMMLLQDKFAEKIWMMYQYDTVSKDKIEEVMQNCNLKYRHKKGYDDLVIAIGNGYKMHGESAKVIDKIAEEIDKVLIRKRWDY